MIVKVLILLLCILHALSRPGEFPCTSGETIESCAAPDDQVVLNTAFFRDLYSQHIDVIKDVRERMIQRKNMTDVGIIEFDPQFDDTEAEILMLLLLFAQPRKVIEFSPCGGWSTSIILDTLQRSVREGLPAHVSSYDLNSQSSVNVKSPDPDSNVEWQLHLGDVAKEYSKWRHDFYVLDYLFIDSDHSAQFTVDYINNLLNPLLSYVRQRKGKKVFVSVHDVFHCMDSMAKLNGGEWIETDGYSNFAGCPSDEGELVLQWLETNNIGYFSPGWSQGNYAELVKIKQEHGIDALIHKSYGSSDVRYQTNSAIFFILQ